MNEEMRNSLAYKTFRAGWYAGQYPTLCNCSDCGPTVETAIETAYVEYVKKVANESRYPLDMHDGRGHN